MSLLAAARRALPAPARAAAASALHLTSVRPASSAAPSPPPDREATPSPLDALAASLASLAAAPPPAHPARSVLTDPHSLTDFVRDVVRSLRARAAVALTRTHIETGFDEAAFLEGAKDAYWLINGVVGDGDWKSVRRAVAPSLLAGLRGVRDAYDRAGLAFSLSVDNSSLSAVIDDMALLSPAALEAVSGAPPAESALPSSSTTTTTTPALAGMHQVLDVRFTGVVNVAVRNGGALVSELIDRRPKVWRFVRGPLPGDLPVRQLDASWTLLGID